MKEKARIGETKDCIGNYAGCTGKFISRSYKHVYCDNCSLMRKTERAKLWKRKNTKSKRSKK